ncbi:acylneuraminate cytidylyltransferase family protein [bacterium]|nr:acylneuraminate cytidylyltransferase family protein [bacterium]MBL7052429.1 acylneuraminate cytidylyltransferase family protein [Candidatus Neomarinimicrobiota bacterium]
MNTLAIIPARGGSKGIPKKNMRTFLGKPLVVHSIETAKESKFVDKIVVSTDDDEIAKISKNAGAEIIERPAEIAGDSATTESAMAHCLDELKMQNYEPNFVVLLQPTSPIRPKNCIDSAVEQMKKEKFDSLLSVVQSHKFFWKQTQYGASASYDFLNRPRRQDISEDEIIWQENGSLYICTMENFRKTGNRLGGKIGLFEMPEECGGEIDTELDFQILEKIGKEFAK